MGRVVLLLIVLIAVFFAVQSKWYHKNKTWKPEAHVIDTLSALADSAAQALDVPVAALLTCNGAIIGTGYNTVKRDGQAGGHAEINAISHAIQGIGLDSFMRLDRARLVLVSTWEPCAMCRGAIIEYGITRVNVLKTKSLSYWLDEWEKQEKYEWCKRAAENDTLQDNLFRRHPLFSTQKRDY